MKPTCNLVGIDGNVFSIIAHVRRTLREAGLENEAREFEGGVGVEEEGDVVGVRDPEAQPGHRDRRQVPRGGPDPGIRLAVRRAGVGEDLVDGLFDRRRRDPGVCRGAHDDRPEDPDRSRESSHGTASRQGYRSHRGSPREA